MVLPTGLTVVESPKELILGANRAYAIDFSNLGTPTTTGDTKAYFQDGNDVSGTVLSGAAQQAGPIITLELFTPNAAGKYRITHDVIILGQNATGILDVEVFAVIPPDTGDRTPATGAYGSVNGVAEIAQRYATRTGTFDDTTRPVVTTVVTMLEQVSSMVDIVMAANGFVIPITTTAVKNALDLWVNSEVAALVEGINGNGRFGPSTKARGGQGSYRSRMDIITEDLENFVSRNVLGFERAGATRQYGITGEIGYRDTDEAGDPIFPLRQRKEFGSIWQDWDK